MTDRLLIPTKLDAAKLSASRASGSVRTFLGTTMGTTWSLRVFSPDSEEGAGTEEDMVLSALDAVFLSVIAQMSGWEPASELSLFNAAASGWRALSPEFFCVLERATEIADATEGAFDPGLGRDGTGRWRDIRLDPSCSAAFQPGGLQLDLSSIAKGFAVDACAEAMEALDITSFLMEIGGEFVGRGLRPDGQPWRVELQLSNLTPAPGEPERTLVALPGHALATSGDFVRGAHILDGRSGAEAGGALSGVAVIAETCMDADGWATALFALGADEGPAMADMQELAAVFALRTNEGCVTRLSAKAAEMLD